MTTLDPDQAPDWESELVVLVTLPAIAEVAVIARAAAAAMIVLIFCLLVPPWH